MKIDLEYFHENKHFWILEGDGVAFWDALRDVLDQDGPCVHRMVSHSEFDLVLFMSYRTDHHKKCCLIDIKLTYGVSLLRVSCEK